MSQKEPLDFSKLTKKDFPLIKDLSHEQEDMVVKLLKKKRVIVDAIAGSGKTTVATQTMQCLKEKGHIDTIYYVVFPVQEGALGFLPGEIGNKIKEYAIPFQQALIGAGINPQSLDLELMCMPEYEGDYKIIPHTFLRGRTYENAGFIIDETQNGTLSELRKTFTRIGDSCYAAIIGHTGQADIPQEQSGFAQYINYFKRGVETGIYPDIEFAQLTQNYRGGFSAFADGIDQYKPTK